MALAVVQTQPVGAGNLATASPVTTNAAITTTTGNLLVLLFRAGSASFITGVTDPGGNTWIPLTAIDPFGVTGQIFYAKNITGWVAGNISVAFSPTPSNNPYGIVYEISGADKFNPLDAQAASFASSSTTVSTTTPLATNFANEIIFAFVGTNGQNNPYVPPTGFTQDAVLPAAGANTLGGAVAHLITSAKQSSVLTYSWTVTSGTTGAVLVAASFIQAGSRPGPGFVQAVGATVSPAAPSLQLPFTNAVVAGDLLVAGFRAGFLNNISSITDSLGVNGNWNIIYNTSSDLGGTFGGWAYTFTKASGPCTVTFNLAVNDFMVIALGEWNNANTFRAASAAVNGTSTTPTSAAVTATASDLLVGFSEINAGTPQGQYVAGAGYTLRVAALAGPTNAFDALEDNLNATGGSTTASFTVGSVTNWNAGIAAFFNTLFAVSGSCGIPFATISYTGPVSGTVFADGSGNYSITGLPNGVYNVTPSAPGKAFTPSSRTVIVVGGNVTSINFTPFTPGGDEGPGFDFTFRI